MPTTTACAPPCSDFQEHCETSRYGCDWQWKQATRMRFTCLAFLGNPLAPQTNQTEHRHGTPSADKLLSINVLCCRHTAVFCCSLWNPLSSILCRSSWRYVSSTQFTTPVPFRSVYNARAIVAAVDLCINFIPLCMLSSLIACTSFVVCRTSASPRPQFTLQDSWRGRCNREGRHAPQRRPRYCRASQAPLSILYDSIDPRLIARTPNTPVPARSAACCASQTFYTQ